LGTGDYRITYLVLVVCGLEESGKGNCQRSGGRTVSTFSRMSYRNVEPYKKADGCGARIMDDPLIDYLETESLVGAFPLSFNIN
jgi:hypothetical protein